MMQDMKKTMGQFYFKPREIKASCESESYVHKARIVGFSVVMASIAGFYEYYFNNLTMRSGQYQMKAMAGDTSV